MQDKIIVGIMGAMEEEIGSLKHKLTGTTSDIIAQREYIKGSFHDVETVLVFSRWGKVAAASTATTLITKYGVNCIIFTGVAGAVSEELNIGDIVIGDQLYQHDMNAEPLFKKHEIPLTGISNFHSHASLTDNAFRSAKIFTNNFHVTFKDQEMLARLSISSPKVVKGKIASGDQFVGSKEKTQEIRDAVPNTLAVEMEGGAVAQVCHEHGVPFVIIRTISDKADHSAHIDFPKFVSEVMTKYSEGIVSEMYKHGFTK
jgi:adenosylhomocysteine nucleosidase